MGLRSVLQQKTRKRNILCMGILTIPNTFKTKGDSYLEKTQIEYLEKLGVRVIPVEYNTKNHNMYSKQLNGILIPDCYDYKRIIQNKSFMYSIKMFLLLSIRNKGYFPILFYGSSFNILLHISGILKSTKYCNSTHDITIDTCKSRLFNSLSKGYIQHLEKSTTLNNHDYGISTIDFLNNPLLYEFYNITSTYKCNNIDFIGSLEARKYPIFGLQWSDKKVIRHILSEFFISELRKNMNKCTVIPPPIHSMIESKKISGKSYYFF
jgi:hypothetical protein